MEILNLCKPKTQALGYDWDHFQNVIPRPASSASLENLEEIQICEPQPRPTKSGTLRIQPAICVLTSLPLLTQV